MALAIPSFAHQKDLAPTPPIGWNSRNHFHSRITQKIVREQASVKFSEIGIHGAASVRDLWLHRNVGTFKGEYGSWVPGHGVVLVRIREKK